MAADLEYDLRSVVEWGKKWQVTFNSTKTKLLSINHFRELFLSPVSMDRSNLPESNSFRFLGMILSRDFPGGLPSSP